MATIPEILASGGVAAILAAAIGGGLEAFGIKVPVLSGRRQQTTVFATGVGLLIAALAVYKVQEQPRMPPPPSSSKIEISGVSDIDFRPAPNADGTNGYLLVTTNVAVINPPDAAAPVLWSGARGILKIGGARVPFVASHFTHITGDNPWLGEGLKSSGPVLLKPGETFRTDLMFTPENTGAGKYPWLTFVTEVFEKNNTTPVFEIVFDTNAKSNDLAPNKFSCKALLDEWKPEILKSIPNWDYRFYVSPTCEK